MSKPRHGETVQESDKSVRDRKNFAAGLTLVVLLLSAVYILQAHGYLALPGDQRVAVGDELQLSRFFPPQALKQLSVRAECDPGIFGGFERQTFGLAQPWPKAIKPGRVKLQLRLFGVIPLKHVVVDVVSPVKVIPGGHSIGVMLRSRGVMVVGFAPVVDQQGQTFYPAKESGIEVGDTIHSINGQVIKNDRDAMQFIQTAGTDSKPMNMEISRRGREMRIKVYPKLCSETHRYRVGLYVRDSAAGVGTLTFYEPRQQKYGALGHVVVDTETNQQMDIQDGRIVKASVQGIQQGRRGEPGEKIGLFNDQDDFSGTIDKNSRYGIFGKLDKPLTGGYYNRLIPVAFTNQVHEGKAEILTVVNGDDVERFSISIERVIPYQKYDGKGMIIKITDPRLLALTGGIIQGMSGSPIIQDGRLAGAVTHVFVNDPTRGYGVMAEWMLMETGILDWKTGQVRERQLSLFCNSWRFFPIYDNVWVISRI
ncbi:MAG: SpoIVB peptidase [Bacillota bacterium]